MSKNNKKLQSLEEFNNQRLTYYYNEMQNAREVLNGLACPKCGSELVDTNPQVILTSNPPKKDVKCSNCNFTGHRIATTMFTI